MRIAICLSGFPALTLEFIEHFNSAICPSGHEYYLFAHCWGDDKDRDKLFDLGVTEAVVEEQKPFYLPIGEREPNLNPQNIFGQLYSISESFQLALESDQEYDLYVRCRCDVFIGPPINYETLNPNKCWMLPLGKPVPPRYSQEYIDNIGILPLPKDFFWVGNKDVAISSSKLFSRVVDFNLNQGIILCPEDLMFHNFAIDKIDVALLEGHDKNGLYRQKHHHGDGLVFYNDKGPYQ